MKNFPATWSTDKVNGQILVLSLAGHQQGALRGAGVAQQGDPYSRCEGCPLYDGTNEDNEIMMHAFVQIHCENMAPGEGKGNANVIYFHSKHR